MAFVALLSVGFLGKEINGRQWTGIWVVISGLAIVGVSDFLLNKESKSGSNSVVTGIFFKNQLLMLKIKGQFLVESRHSSVDRLDPIIEEKLASSLIKNIFLLLLVDIDTFFNTLREYGH